MTAPPTFDDIFKPQPRQPTARERGAEAGVGLQEAQLPTAPRRAAAQTARDEALAERERFRFEQEQRDAEIAKEAEKEAEEEARKAGMRQREKTLNYLGTIQRAKDLISGGGATGLVGQITKQVWGSDAAGLDAILASVANPIVLEAMQEARKGSKVGATGFGALSERELDLLKASWGSLRQSQKPEDLMRVLGDIERHYRRFMAYNAGYSPDKVEGAILVGLAPPEGSIPPPSGEVGPKGVAPEDPEIRGLMAAGASMVKAGRSPEQIRQWYNEYRPGLGDGLDGVEETVAYWNDVGRERGEEPIFTMGPSTEEGAEPSLLGSIADTSVGAAAVAAADQFGLGYIDESNPFVDPEVSSAISRGLREKYPRASLVGDVVGGVGSAVGGTALAGRLGLRGPAVLEGIGQEFVRGTGQAEPGQRLAGGVEQAVYGVGGNLAGRFAGDLIGGTLRGADPDARVLTEKYGIDLTPGQLAGDVGPERMVAGLPIAGPQVQARRNESLLQFNKAAFDETLAPIGAQVDNIGQRGVADVQAAISDAYEAALGGRAFQFDTPFAQTVRGKPYLNLASMKGDVGPKAAGEIDRILNEINVNGVADGRAWQQARRQLVDLQGSPEVLNSIGGDAVVRNVDEVIDAFDDLVKRQAPDAYEGYIAANTAYRNSKILERAVDNAKDGDIFGPGNLRAATRQGTRKFGGSAASARGDRPFNELAMAGLDRIPEKTGDASMFGRIVGPSAVGGGVGTGVALTQVGSDEAPQPGDGSVPAWALGGIGAAALAALPYSKAGVRLRSGVLGGPRTPQQRTLGQMLTEYGGSLGRGLTAGLTVDPGAPMPENFDYSSIMGSPEFQRILEEAAANSEALTAEERKAIYRDFSKGSTFRDVDNFGNEIDPETGLPIREEFKRGGAVRGYQDGGAVRGRQPGAPKSDQEINRNVTMMITQGRTADDIRQYLDSIEPGLGARAEYLDENIAYFNETGRNPGASINFMSGFNEFGLLAGRRGADFLGMGADLVDLTSRYLPSGMQTNLRDRLNQSWSDVETDAAYRGGKNVNPILDSGMADAYLPAELGYAGDRLSSIPSAMGRVIPRAAQSVYDYAQRTTPQQFFTDARDVASQAYDSFVDNPSPFVVDGMSYFGGLAIPSAATDFSKARRDALDMDMLSAELAAAGMPGDAEYSAGDRDVMDAMSPLYALGVPLGARASRATTRRKRGGLAVKKRKR